MSGQLSLYPWLAPARKPKMREIAHLVAERHGLTVSDLTSLSRTKLRVVARQEAMALIYETGRFSLPQIGRFLGRDHTTVLHGVRAYRRRQDAARAVEA